MVEEDTTKEELNNNEQPFDSAQGKLKELELKCDEYLNNWKRERADFLNYKKEEMERIGFLGKYVKEDIILKILPILDNFYLAEKQLPENLKTKAKGNLEKSPQIEWTRGFLQIHKQIEEFLKKEGIEEIKAIGQKFDPETMEAVGEAETASAEASASQEKESGIVIEEVQKGYKIDGKVLRPAKVKVTK